MILSVIQNLLYKLEYSQRLKSFTKVFQFLAIAISLFVLAVTLHQNESYSLVLKLQHPVLMFILLFLALLNLTIETDIWQHILKKVHVSNFGQIFRLVVISYTFKTISTQFIGALIGKSSLFGFKGIKENIFKHISFGFYQSLATIYISILILGFYVFRETGILFLGDFSLFHLLIGMGIISLLCLGIVFFLFKLKFSLSITFRALLRTSVYYLQFAITLYYLYGLDELLIGISAIAFYFILKTLLPVFNMFGGIGLRELTLAYIFMQFGLNPQGIVFGAVLIWFSNFVFPNILGIILLSKKSAWSLHTS